MKYIIILFLLSPYFLSAQNIDTLDRNDDLYYQSLKLHISYLKELFAESLVFDPLEYVYVEKKHYYGDYSGFIDSIQVIMVDYDEIFKMTKHKKTFHMIIISPIKSKKGKLIIYVVNIKVSRKRKRYTYASSEDRTVVEVKYNCETNKYELEVINHKENNW